MLSRCLLLIRAVQAPAGAGAAGPRSKAHHHSPQCLPGSRKGRWVPAGAWRGQTVLGASLKAPGHSQLCPPAPSIHPVGQAGDSAAGVLRAPRSCLLMVHRDPSIVMSCACSCPSHRAVPFCCPQKPFSPSCQVPVAVSKSCGPTLASPIQKMNYIYSGEVMPSVFLTAGALLCLSTRSGCAGSACGLGAGRERALAPAEPPSMHP